MQLNLGTKIRELRRRDGCTQENLAEFLGVSAQAVSRWESGGSYPDMEMIPSIANFFHISIDELFGYNDNREKRIDEIVTCKSIIIPILMVFVIYFNGILKIIIPISIYFLSYLPVRLLVMLDHKK